MNDDIDIIDLIEKDIIAFDAVSRFPDLGFSENIQKAIGMDVHSSGIKISENLDKWSIDRIAKTDLAILRTAVAEMLYVDSIPVSVSINEAVNLAKKYGDDRSYAFINSVLGKISRSI